MKKIIMLGMIGSLIFSIIYAKPRITANKPKYGDRIIVQYKENISSDDISAFKNMHGFELQDKESMISYIENTHHLTKIKKSINNVPFVVYQLQAQDKANIESIAKEISTESAVLFAHPDHYMYAFAYPNDTYYQDGCQWGFSKVQADTAYNAGLINTNKNKVVIVADLDTGILLTPQIHEDLAGRTINGINIIDTSIPPNDDDVGGGDLGHGTHVAGIIAANTNNGLGIAGAAYMNSSWTAKVLLMPVKVLDNTGSGYESDIISGMNWAVSNGANVINMSLGEDQGDDALQTAVNAAFSQGCVLVAAAGNGDEYGNPEQTSYPAAYPNVIAVAATDRYDQVASFSNYGKIDVSAPGISIMSCDASGPSAFSGSYNDDYNYSHCDSVEMDGTSFATPFVSGLAALLFLKYDNITPDQIINIIEQTADILGGGYNVHTGWGRINVYRALSGNINTPGVTGTQIKTYNWPNPFSPTNDGFTRITFVIANPAPVSIKVYDGGGYLVWSDNIDTNNVSTGYNFVQWNGINSGGKKVANGTYFYTVQSQGTYGKNKIEVLY